MLAHEQEVHAGQFHRPDDSVQIFDEFGSGKSLRLGCRCLRWRRDFDTSQILDGEQRFLCRFVVPIPDGLNSDPNPFAFAPGFDYDVRFSAAGLQHFSNAIEYPSRQQSIQPAAHAGQKRPRRSRAERSAQDPADDAAPDRIVVLRKCAGKLKRSDRECKSDHADRCGAGANPSHWVNCSSDLNWMKVTPSGFSSSRLWMHGPGTRTELTDAARM